MKDKAKKETLSALAFNGFMIVLILTVFAMWK